MNPIEKRTKGIMYIPMKVYHLFLLISCCLFTAANAQQVPQAIPYQAVIRDHDGQVRPDLSFDLQVLLRAGGPAGPVVYRESHRIVTDREGRFSLLIGEGNRRSGSLTEVPWQEGDIWLDLVFPDEMAEGVYAGRLLTVPYAFHAATAGRVQDTEKNVEGFWGMVGNISVDSNHYVGHKLNHKLEFRTDGKPGLIIRADGTVYIPNPASFGGLHVEVEKYYSYPNGSETNFEDYPFRIEGSDQGMAIMINESRSNGNNFLSFWAEDGNALGRVEGQRESEWNSSDDFITFHVFMGLNIVFLALEASSSDDILEKIVNGVFAALYAGALVSHDILERNHLGVTYESGGADYAEWLPKADTTAEFLAGEIIGVKGGRISLETADADQLLVISLHPVAVGNMPLKNREHLYEKAAFKGQTPTRVTGEAAVGDYIVPSGENDGLGRAIHPEDMTLTDYRQVVGIAWTAAKSKGVNLVNVAIGLHPNSLHGEISRQQDDLDEMETQLNDVIDYLSETRKDFDVTPTGQYLSEKQLELPTDFPLPAAPTPYDPETMRFDEWIDENRDIVRAQVEQIRKNYEASGLDISRYPAMEYAFKDPLQTIKDVHAGIYLVKLLEMMKQNKNE